MHRIVLDRTRPLVFLNIVHEVENLLKCLTQRDILALLQDISQGLARLRSSNNSLRNIAIDRNSESVGFVVLRKAELSPVSVVETIAREQHPINWPTSCYLINASFSAHVLQNRIYNSLVERLCVTTSIFPAYKDDENRKTTLTMNRTESRPSLYLWAKVLVLSD